MSFDEANLVKVGIIDPDGDTESLWAEALGDNRYRLENTPFFAYGLSADDIVEALPEEDGFLMFSRVIEKSGHRTLRVSLDEPVQVEPGPTLLAEIKRLGCTYEGASNTLICIDIPPEVPLKEVAEMLIRLDVGWEYADPTEEKLSRRG